MANIEAAVFDIDGFLLDTREWIMSAYEHTFAAHGIAVPSRVEMARYIGGRLDDCYRLMAPDADNALLGQTHRDFQSENIHLVEPYSGLTDMLDELHGKVKIAGNSNRFGSVERTLEHAGILGYFDTLVFGNDVKKPKPDPEGILMALGRLGVEPAKTSMSGDSVEDIQAGKAANVAITIAITHGFGTLEDLSRANPDYIVSNLAELPSLILA